MDRRPIQTGKAASPAARIELMMTMLIARPVSRRMLRRMTFAPISTTTVSWVKSRMNCSRRRMATVTITAVPTSAIFTLAQTRT
ncbi:hypothetical protein D3C76_1617080 [compost metagenome]